ncbi:uncharacterized protein GJ701_002723 isoform 1-T3 [Geothlypis trichas]
MVPPGRAGSRAGGPAALSGSPGAPPPPAGAAGPQRRGGAAAAAFPAPARGGGRGGGGTGRAAGRGSRAGREGRGRSASAAASPVPSSPAPSAAAAHARSGGAPRPPRLRPATRGRGLPGGSDARGGLAARAPCRREGEWQLLGTAGGRDGRGWIGLGYTGVHRMCSSHTARAAEGKGRDWENEESPAGEDRIQGYVKHLKVHKPMGPDEMYPHVLKNWCLRPQTNFYSFFYTTHR